MYLAYKKNKVKNHSPPFRKHDMMMTPPAPGAAACSFGTVTPEHTLHEVLILNDLKTTFDIDNSMLTQNRTAIHHVIPES